MSWKGIQKSVVRAPQNLRQKFNIGETTKDAVFIDAERRFKELEGETKKLHDETNKYYSAINSMLTHQIEFSKAIEEIYKPISGRASDPNAAIPEGNPEGIAACEQYRQIVLELQETIQPELEMLDTRVVKPADELLEIVKHIRKLIVKRSHKQLDLDRHANSLKKLQEKKEKTLKDEKAIYQVENNVEIATQEYNYYNDMLKEDLPKLFTLETEFIKPLFQSFYYMQLNIFYTLYDHMNQNNIAYFQLHLNDDIEATFNSKRGDVQERAEAVGITQFNKQRSKKKLDPKFRKPGAPGSVGSGNRVGSMGSVGSDGSTPPPYSATSPYNSTGYGNGYQPAEYESSATPATGYAPQSYTPQPYGAAPVTASPTQYQQAPPVYTQPAQYDYSSLDKKAPPPQPATNGAEYCIAQFDYAAQAQGDLTFRAGDRIEIVQRTADPNGWWTGKLNNAVGVFPGNYVQLES
ncbi:BAR domain-containing protein [Dipodascopsis uninucleata]